MKIRFSLIAAAVVAAIVVLLAPAPALATDDVVLMPKSLVARVQALEASTNSLFNAQIQAAVNDASNRIVALQAVVTSSTNVLTADTNTVAGFVAWKAAGINGVVTNSLTATNVMTFSSGLATNRVTMGQ